MTIAPERPPLVNIDDDRYEAGKFDGVFIIPDRSGDTRIMWDRRNADEVEMARASFAAAVGRGMRVYKAEGKEGTQGELITEFDPEAERLIAIPQLQGG